MSTYSLTLRENLGRKLTIQEMDGNFQYLDNKSGGGSQNLTDVLSKGDTFSRFMQVIGGGGFEIIKLLRL